MSELPIRFYNLRKGFSCRSFIGGSDARIIMGNDKSALQRLWQEKRGEVERLGGFAADYFRGHPSALRAAGLSGARCGGFGEADARLITIGELDASRLECTL